MVDGGAVAGVVIPFSLIGILFALYRAWEITQISLSRVMPDALRSDDDIGDDHPAYAKADSDGDEEKHGGAGGGNVFDKIKHVSNAISTGANAFLLREYIFMALFVVVFSILILILIGSLANAHSAGFTCIAFIVGAVTSIVSGFLGMKIAVYSNSRTAIRAMDGWGPAFTTAFKAGCVMGFALTSIALFVLFILVNFFRLYWTDVTNDPHQTAEMFECVTGYGLGGSSVALFARVGGGIYTKAADVGADLCGKLEMNIPEDDPRNPAVIADNVGDNVGDIAGMGADLFGSYAESTCAALVIAAQQGHGVLVNDPNFILGQNWATLMFPLFITATGIIVSLITSFVATHLMVVKDEKGIEPSCKRQLVVSTLLMTPVVIILTQSILPASFSVSTATEVKNYYIFFCIAAGLWSGLIIGLITEYFTSNAYKPVQEVADACKTGAATNIIYGLALGYKSTIIPVFCLAFTIYISFRMAGMYGIAMAALGILSTMATALTIDAYGPICDNAGGIAEMCGMGPEIRKKTDALDAAGNTTAAIGKGFAIGSAAFVSVALFGAYSTVVGLSTVDIMRPFVFAGLLVGAMLPYWFSAMTMKSVGKAALDMVEEVRRQFQDIPGLMDGTGEPDYARCVAISTQASLREMLAPGALVLITPLVTGYGLGTEALAGLLVGTIVSGIQMAISSSNTGGAWDNAKKYIESGHLGGKGSAPHKAAVIGDTVGDPLKDTSGPSLNILIKLSAIISVVFARSFPSTGYLVQLFKG